MWRKTSLRLVADTVLFSYIVAQAAALPTTPGAATNDLATPGQTLLVATAPVTPATPSYAPLVTPTTLQVSISETVCGKPLASHALILFTSSHLLLTGLFHIILYLYLCSFSM